MACSYMIVGSGVFGASAALELAKCKPGERIILVDEFDTPNPAGASSDLNKIVRADYRDPFYAKLAVDALKFWKHHHIYAPHFHETGMLFAESEGKGPASLHNLQKLGAAEGARIMTVEEARSAFPALKSANWNGVEGAYFNPGSGWAEADAAMAAVIEECRSLGVQSCRAKVARLSLRQQPADSGSTWRCDGIVTKEGIVLHADRVLLCTGASTAKLIADSAPGDQKLQIKGRLVAAAALQCYARVTPEKLATCQRAPVFANLMSHTAGEAIPVNSAGHIKINYERTFTNYEYHYPSGQLISSPSKAIGAGVFTDCAPQQFIEDAANLLRNMYGPEASQFKIEKYRVCWDAITPTQDWLITPHTHCTNLYFAGGGSFHAFKFLPVLGREIVAMMDGTLDEEKAHRWSWNRTVNTEQGACDSYFPQRDLKDILAKTERIKSRA